MTGSKTSQTWWIDDGFISYPSQSPSFVNASRKLRAVGANHREEVAAHPQAMNKIIYALTKYDIDLATGPPPPSLDVDITGPSHLFLGPGENDPHVDGDYTANPTGGSGGYTYDWFRKNDGAATFGSLNKHTRTITVRSYGESFTLKVIVYDSQGNSDFDTKHVTVGDW